MAISIVFDFSYRFETMQRSVGMAGYLSSFSSEDLATNRTGIEIAIRFWRLLVREGRDVSHSADTLAAENPEHLHGAARTVLRELRPLSTIGVLDEWAGELVRGTILGRSSVRPFGIENPPHFLLTNPEPPRVGATRQ
ncbi:hypothetical protein [Piscinibacter sp. XHJ-5]|uniref:hypothetical protein n=1 Tax=Piscinibacter sp. XHJ-5 TaxID=3037797 RepID=UPI0024530D2A|nr:hypothetical protein [Piscinibacter sp. XHJ-5]